jgi:hypothetical protein
MPVTPQDKPLELLREEVIDQLIMNYGHGQISLQAFERRLDSAVEAQDHQALLELTADLSLQVDTNYTEKKKEEFGVNYSSASSGERSYVINIFGGSDRRGTWQVPAEIVVICLFGGGKLDFSEARFSRQTVRLRIFCLFGGEDILVSENINTRSNLICLFGGVDDRGSSSSDRDAPTIIIEGLVLFGGVVIKVKRMVREQLVDFANQLKSLFTTER